MKNLKKAFLIVLMATISIPAFAQQEDFDKTLKDAEAGNTEAMYNLAILYYKGSEISKDYSKAKYWFEKAAEKGNALSMYYLGDLYSDGIGVEQDIDKSIEWYIKAAENGHVEAMLLIGQIYLVDENFSEALHWLSEAKDKGNATAIYTIGFMWENGLGMVKNKTEAEKLYKLAESTGVTDEMLIISYYYYDGIGGIPVNEAKGKFWLDKACQAGNENACSEIMTKLNEKRRDVIAWIKEKLQKYERYEGSYDDYQIIFYKDIMVNPCEISFKIYTEIYDSEYLESSISFNPSLIKEWKVNADKNGIYTDAKVIEKTTYKYDGTMEKTSFVNDLFIESNEGEKDLLENMIEKLLLLATFCEE